ncbi:hypothetical protein CEXT_731031 [Caerostris extrusa]|uniref:Uncharacterized protein n=1 Tax=Caerostris extrusa TaxID=172846 RepID=A0AAV4YCK2_CAEEX|nr:hypothetical protein CEXT_731031 [Caerostris extrusa]
MVTVSVTFEENPLSFFALSCKETEGTSLFETVTGSLSSRLRGPRGKKKNPPEYFQGANQWFRHCFNRALANKMEMKRKEDFFFSFDLEEEN